MCCLTRIDLIDFCKYYQTHYQDLEKNIHFKNVDFFKLL